MPLPKLFKENIQRYFPNDWEKIITSLASERRIRALLNNPNKYENIKSERVPWNEQAYFIKNDRSLIDDPLYHAGCYYAQEPASTIVHYLMEQSELPKDPWVLDLCAAPGGKSLNILNFLNGEGVLLANEVDTKRNSILQENLIKWTHPNKIVTQSPAESFAQLGPLFDVILIDAPCSGEGMFRKSTAAIDQWGEQLINQCATTQEGLLINADQCLIEGGVLIYSTCTLNPMENEANAIKILSLGYDEININLTPSWNIRRAKIGYYFLPGIAKGEGLYFSVFRKTKPGKRINKKEKINLKSLYETGTSDKYYQIADRYFQLNPNVLELLAMVEGKVKIKHAGILSFRDKGKIQIPEIELSLAEAKQWFDGELELELKDARAYLRGETLRSDRKGWIRIKYSGKTIGLAKGAGNRLNNHYPKNWRIRKTT